MCLGYTISKLGYKTCITCSAPNTLQPGQYIDAFYCISKIIVGCKNYKPDGSCNKC